MRRVVIVNYAFAPAIVEPEATIDAFVALREFALGLRCAGADVAVVQRFHRDATLRRDEIEYDFVGDGRRGRPHPLAPTSTVHRRVARWGPDVVHVNGLVFPVQTRSLRRWVPRSTAIVVQHHAELPRRGWRGALQRWGLAAADGFLFTAEAQALAWRAARRIPAAAPVFEVMEGSTGLTPPALGARVPDRGRRGAPTFLWVGRLQEVKDPLTLLAGFDLLLGHVPDAHLIMVFGEDDLRGEVEARLAASPRLRAAVTLLGRVPHDELAARFAVADYFVAASLREGSGFALSEALAFGVVPIVTDIPSFAKMTDGGRVGGLWRPRDPVDFARVALQVLARPHAPLAQAAEDHYRSHLSRDAIGRQALAAYGAVIARRRGASA